MLEKQIIPTISKTLIEYESNNFETINSHSQQVAIAAIAKGHYCLAETSILGQLETVQNPEVLANQLWLLCQIYNRQHMPHSNKSLIVKMAKCVSPTDQRLTHLILQMARYIGDRTSGPISLTKHTNGKFPHLDIEICMHYLWRGDITNAENMLTISNARDSCEGILVNAKICKCRGDIKQAEHLLLAGWAKYKYRLDYALCLIGLLFELRRGDICLPIIKEALSIQGCYGSPLLEWLCKAKSLQREPAIALRLKILERLPKIAGAKVNTATSLGCAYNDLGRSDWMVYLQDNVASNIAENFDLHSNQLMQLSSITSPTYPKACRNVVTLLTEHINSQLPEFDIQRSTDLTTDLRIGWICGDINNHPVARFLYSWLAIANKNLTNQHIVVATKTPDSHFKSLFSNLSKVKFIDQSSEECTPIEKVKQLRDLKLDIAIDLNGWTGNNSMIAFISRIAPLQVNYLAYHASSGINEMDAWIGDDNVFPTKEHLEWHTEQIVRLPRPFMAWNPQPGLPETEAKVTEISQQSDSGIRFGTFNNLRKISDESLKCWGRILSRVPQSKLTLKAHSSTDMATAKLIERKLERNGIAKEKIIWLPYTTTANEHLLQYQEMDVALDTFPNSGCTTTCEALWMGVPVITLQGQHYVSRMASAVLKGAGLPDWVCNSVDDYERLAIRQAEQKRLTWLRENRTLWRQSIIDSPLGDANDLMNELERCLCKLFNELPHK